MPGNLTEITELGTALGVLGIDLHGALALQPPELRHVPEATWAALVAAHRGGEHADTFATAHANGRALRTARDGLRDRPPRLVEWRGPHQPPGDDIVPADLRIDHVYLVSCKYLSKVLLNPSPSRLFDRRLVGRRVAGGNWFAEVAPEAFAALYRAAVAWTGLADLPAEVADLTKEQGRRLRDPLRPRQLPDPLVGPWADLCEAVSEASARRWAATLGSRTDRLQLLWRLLRITNATYFVLGADRTSSLRLRVGAQWDWLQAWELRAFEVAPRASGQPEVGWTATVRERASGREVAVDGHVEVRWSHGRFVGAPEAKVYLDTPLAEVPGYHPLV